MYQQNEAESMAALELLHIKNNQPSNLECRSASKLLCNILSLSSRVDVGGSTRKLVVGVWGEDSHRIDAAVPSSSKVTTKKKKKSRASELYDMLYHVLYIYLCTRCVLYFVMHQK
jgi:hypothetical protein